MDQHVLKKEENMPEDEKPQAPNEAIIARIIREHLQRQRPPLPPGPTPRDLFLDSLMASAGKKLKPVAEHERPTGEEPLNDFLRRRRESRAQS
jgi:hypothetical protein